MDQEIREKLSQTYKLAEENNRLLHKLNRALVWARVWGFLKWIIIIGSTVGVYYYFQPQIEALMELNASVWDAVGGAKEALEGFNQQFSR